MSSEASPTAIFGYRLDAKGQPQPFIDHDPKRHMKGTVLAVFQVVLPPEWEGLGLDSLVKKYPPPPTPPSDTPTAPP